MQQSYPTIPRQYQHATIPPNHPSQVPTCSNPTQPPLASTNMQQSHTAIPRKYQHATIPPNHPSQVTKSKYGTSQRDVDEHVCSQMAPLAGSNGEQKDILIYAEFYLKITCTIRKCSFWNVFNCKWAASLSLLTWNQVIFITIIQDIRLTMLYQGLRPT